MLPHPQVFAPWLSLLHIACRAFLPSRASRCAAAIASKEWEQRKTTRGSNRGWMKVQWHVMRHQRSDLQLAAVLRKYLKDRPEEWHWARHRLLQGSIRG